MIVELIENVHLIASGRLGFSTTDDHDCNVYLATFEREAVLIDAGCGLSTQAIVTNIESTGVSRVTRILVTHAHADHAAGALDLASALGAEIWAPSEVATILESGDEEAAGLDAARSSGMYPSTVRLRPTAVARHFTEGSLHLNRVEIMTIATPGHARGHVGFFCRSGGRRVLFSGDAVFARGRVVTTPDVDLRAMAGSITRLSELKPDVLLPGHCEPVLDHATTHLEESRAFFERGAVPPQLA